MKKRICTVGFCIPGYEESELDFSSQSSFMGYDLILFSPILPYYKPSYSFGGKHKGKRCLDDHSSTDFVQDARHWKRELTSALQSGKTVFFILSEFDDFYIDSGERSITGTGRNQRNTVLFQETNNYSFLPVDIGSLFPASGKQVTLVDHAIFGDFFKRFKKYLDYKVYLESVGGEVIFTGSEQSKVLGAVYPYDNGYFITLPNLSYSERDFIDGENWTDEAVQFGEMLVDSILAIDKKLTTNSIKSPQPEWVAGAKFISKKELELTEKIDKISRDIVKLQDKKARLDADLSDDQLIKDLLFEQGKPLENAVIDSLVLLGYCAENYQDDDLELDQVITSPEGNRYIGECEGKDNKGIDISKFRQLSESLSADFAREDVIEKAFGILFGNPQRLISPEERTLDFTRKCKLGAEREKIALVRTADLFNVVKYLKENDDEQYKQKCRDAIHAGLGSVVEFPAFPKQDD